MERECAIGQGSGVGGQWSVVGGRWSVVGGQWSVVGGQWSVVGGQWSVVGGPWFFGSLVSWFFGFLEARRAHFGFDSTQPSTSTGVNCHRRSREAQGRADLRERVSERQRRRERKCGLRQRPKKRCSGAVAREFGASRLMRVA